MTSLEESRLNSVLRRGLKGIEGLPESARSADESITKYLKQKLGELMVSDYKKRSSRNEDGEPVAELATQVLDEVVLDAQKLYELFELHLKNQLDGFWEGLDPEGKVREAVGAESGRDAVEPATGLGSLAINGSYSNGTGRTSIGGGKFICIEGCVIEGDLAYLAHRDRGHHPVPA
jgi:hypothetical protein